jgi:DNA-directed RNA polymerase subunit RPC12/RpoP
MQRFRCAICGDGLGEETNLDHKIPIGDGGTDEIGNLQILCLRCHFRKTSAETSARNAGRSEYNCITCGATYSKHFVRNHVHAGMKDGERAPGA